MDNLTNEWLPVLLLDPTAVLDNRRTRQFLRRKVNSANLFLVLIVGSTVPALAAFTGKHWKVQPPFAEWFVTRDGVTHWRKIA